MSKKINPKVVSDYNSNKAFKKDYDKLFKEDPITANLLLLFIDIADDNGQFELPNNVIERDTMLTNLLNARFEDPEQYQL